MSESEELSRPPAPFEVARMVESLCSEALPALDVHINNQLRRFATRAVIALLLSQVPMAVFVAVGAWGNGTLRTVMFVYWGCLVVGGAYLLTQEHLPYHQHHRKLQRQLGELLGEANRLRTTRPLEISEQEAQALWSQCMLLLSDVRGA